MRYSDPAYIYEYFDTICMNGSTSCMSQCRVAECLLITDLIVMHSCLQLACLSTMGGAYSICRYPKEALQIAKRQELIGIRMGSKQVQCHAKLYQYINLIFMGRKKAGLRMLEAAKEQANELESDSVRKHCDVTENWLKNEIKYKYSHKGGTDPKVNKLVTPNVQLLK